MKRSAKCFTPLKGGREMQTITCATGEAQAQMKRFNSTKDLRHYQNQGQGPAPSYLSGRKFGNERPYGSNAPTPMAQERPPQMHEYYDQ